MYFWIVVRLLKSQIWSKIVKNFRRVHKLYFLEIKEVLVLFCKISSLPLWRMWLHRPNPSFLTIVSVAQFLLDGTIHVEHTASTSSPYTHANNVHTYAHVLGTKATNVHSTIQFVSWYISRGFSCICDTAFVIVHTYMYVHARLEVHKKLARKPTNQPLVYT